MTETALQAAPPDRGRRARGTPLWHPFANMAEVDGAEIVLVAGDGCEVVDREGRRYLDATASLWYCNVGHGRPEIAEAIAEQLGRLAKAGVQRVMAQWLEVDDVEGLEALARAVPPQS